MSDLFEDRLRDSRIGLPEPTQHHFEHRNLGNGNKLLYVSGLRSFGERSGQIGEEISTDEGRELTRLCLLSVLANLRAACGSDLNRVVRCVKMTAFMKASPEFKEHPRVLDSASDLLVEIFGQAGKHARSAIGTDDLPPTTAVKIETVFEVRC